nr:sugar-binding domain-containing protein [Staphylococcus saprophyticus]
MPVTIPGSIVTGALENNLINHPYYGNNEDAIQYLFNDHYSFSRTFTLETEVLMSEQILLNCEGLDTLATIFINHTNVLETDNMFRRYKFDIKPYVELGENIIEIQFYSPVQYLKEIKLQGENGLAYLRKAQCMFGWDWGIKFLISVYGNRLRLNTAIT